MGVEIFLVWTLIHYLSRRERRLAFFVPYAAIAFVFVSFVNAGAGMAWRYIGDFWPLVVLVGVQYAQTLPLVPTSALGLPLAAVLLTGANAAYLHDIEPAHRRFDRRARRVGRPRACGRTLRGRRARPRTSRCRRPLRCGAVPAWPHFDVFWRSTPIAWGANCSVGTVTELFVGVPAKTGDSYVLSLATGGMSYSSILVAGSTGASTRRTRSRTRTRPTSGSTTRR